MKVLSIFGTRPEAIKMAPIVKEIEKHPAAMKSVVCVTGQHRQMLDQVLNLFQIRPDYDLDIMRPDQDLFDVTCGVLKGLKQVFEKEQPGIVLVHGDTTTTMAAALASYYCKTRVGHVEAGLRTQNKYAPFPEEINRRVAGVLSDMHFAPTETAKINLMREGISEKTIFVTGNTVIDALLTTSNMIRVSNNVLRKLDDDFSFLDRDKRLILVTGHRRENFGKRFENICLALSEIAETDKDVEILYPVHPNPHIQEAVRRILKKKKLDNVHIVEPLDYLPFVYLMERSYLVLTDSGGVQEEAPSLGKPVLVTRDTTERPEAVTAGTVRLVGADKNTIVEQTLLLLTDPRTYHAMSMAHNPYGDGKAALRISRILQGLKAV